MENYEKAEKDYMAGMKYKDIAEKYNTTINTVKSWKQRYGWDRKKGVRKNERRGVQNKTGPRDTLLQTDDGTKETLQNDDLSAEQQMFCIYYSRTFNATQSYLKAYGCAYSTALTNGPALLRNTRVKAEIERLKEIKRQQIVAGEEDIVELQMRIAFVDIGDILDFGDAGLVLRDSGRMDTQMVRSVKEGKFGVSVEVEDRQKAINWLSKYFLMHPDDKYKAAFDRKKAEFDTNERESDGFMEALKEGTAEMFKEAGDSIET